MADWGNSSVTWTKGQASGIRPMALKVKSPHFNRFSVFGICQIKIVFLNNIVSRWKFDDGLISTWNIDFNLSNFAWGFD